LAPAIIRKVEFAPEPRSTTLLFIEMPVERLKVPGPSKTYVFGGHPAICLLIVTAVPVEGVIVEPHCAQLASGIPPTTPACVQSIAREGLMIPDHNCWAWEKPGRTSKINKNNSHCGWRILISSYLIKRLAQHSKTLAVRAPLEDPGT
jgi:hypothetical protein